MLNRYPLWKYALVAIVVVVGLLYALPNIFGDEPAVEFRAGRTSEINSEVRQQVESAMADAGISVQAIEDREQSLLLRFGSEDDQFQARKVLRDEFGRDFTTALTLESATPGWLRAIGGRPMYLGLDLRGGVHFLLEVDVAAASERHLQSSLDQARDLLREERVRFSGSRLVDGAIELRFRDAVEADKALPLLERQVEGAAWEASEQDGESWLTGRFSESWLTELTQQIVDQNVVALRNRIDELGVAEPVVQKQDTNRIVVQLPGVQDPARAKEVLGRTATLEVMLVDEQNNDRALTSGVEPVGSKLFGFRDGRELLLKERIIYTGENIIDAKASIDTQTGGPIVSIQLDGQGASINSRVTGDNINNRMAVVYAETVSEQKLDSEGRPILDDEGRPERTRQEIREIITAPVIRSQLGARFQIEGLDSVQEAQDIALLLRAGSLSAPVEIIEERTIGPSLGRANIEQGFQSVVIGLAAVFLFILLYYRRLGIFPDIALAVNLVLVVAILSLLQATLTLPGVAGMVLTIGMAVDANVLIYERIREELRNGTSPQKAIHNGYERAFGTILDANLTTLLAALMLFYFGTGPIKGFAVTLSIGILTSIFTAVMLTRSLINWQYGGKNLKDFKVPSLFPKIAEGESHFDFLSKAKFFLPLSVLVLVASIGLVAFKGLNLGLDFTGGTLVETRFERGVEVEDLRSHLAGGEFGDAEIQLIGSDGILVKLPPGADQTSSAEAGDRLLESLRTFSGESFANNVGGVANCARGGEVVACSVQLESVSFVGPRFGEQLLEKGGIALLIVLGAILVYVSIRFQWKYAVAANLALLHDPLLTLGLFALFGWEFNITVLAAVLAVIGYSINDTIVVFDRIRESFRRISDLEPKEVMNTAINQTLSRTMLTSLTTLLVVVSLLIFGGETLRGFSIALLIGVLVGTYSSIFFAAPIALRLGANREDLVPKTRDDGTELVDDLP